MILGGWKVSRMLLVGCLNCIDLVVVVGGGGGCRMARVHHVQMVLWLVLLCSSSNFL